MTESIMLYGVTLTVDNITVGKADEVEFNPEVKMVEVPCLGFAYSPYNLVAGRKVVLKFKKIFVDDTQWNNFSYLSYPSYSKALSTTTLVMTNVVSSVAKTHTITITGPQIMKWSLKGSSKEPFIEDIEITGTGCTVATT